MNNDIKNVLDFLNIHLNIPTLVVDEDEENLCLFEKNHFQFSNFQFSSSKDFLKAFFNRADKTKTYVVEDSFKICYVTLYLGSNWCILGPYIDTVWTDNQFDIFLATHNIPKSYFYDYKVTRCKYTVISTKRILTYTQSLLNTFSNQLISQNVVYVESSDENIEIDHFNTNDQDIKQIIKSYEIENIIISAIKAGNAKETVEAWKKIPISARHKDAYQSSRILQFSYFSILKTIARKAAEDAGVDILLINSISQEYAQKIHNITNVSSLTSLSERMLCDFAEAVHKKQTMNYSLLIIDTINYINFSISTNLKITEIAKYIGVSEAHLSRQFKSEVGETISNYIKIKRMNKAAELLRATTLPIQNISNYVGYADSNYFVKLFKSVYTLSPSAYRKSSPPKTHHSRVD